MRTFGALFGVSRESADLVGIAVAACRDGYAVLPVAPAAKNPLCTLTPTARARADKAASSAAKENGHRGWMNVRHSNSGECGVKHAITDENEARRVFKRLTEAHPELNLALEVGRSRMLCVDADTVDQVRAFTALWAKESGVAALEYVLPTVSSPGVLKDNNEWTHKGGGHFWFVLPEGVDFSEAGTSVGLVLPGGAVVYFKDRVLLVPPSTRPEGAYVLQSDPGTAPAWLVDMVTMHIDGFAERRKLQRERIMHDDDPIDVWSADTPWASILEPDGWTSAHKFDSCQCEIWTRPGEDWSNPKSATAHETGCTQWDMDTGFLHIWTDDPPEYIRAYIDSTGSRSLSKLQYVAWRDHDGNIREAMGELDLGRIVERQSFDDLVGPQNDGDFGDLLDPEKALPEGPNDELEKFLKNLYKRSELETIPPPVWLVKHWLTRDSLARLSGKPGSYKTFVSLDMACCVATGRPYHGEKVEQGKVLYIAAEGVSGIKLRVKAWEEANGVTVSDENLHVFSGAVRVDSAKEWGLLCVVTKMHQYDLIVLDTQARMTTGMDESDNSAMNIFIDRISFLKDVSKACVLTVHHAGHDQNRGRGASSVWAAMDTELFLDRDKESQVSKLDFRKSKESSEDFTLCFKAREHQLGEDEDGEPVTSLTLYPVEAPQDAQEGDDPSGRVAYWIERLDALGVPSKAGRDACKTALSMAGHTTLPRNETLAEVVRRRKARSSDD